MGYSGTGVMTQSGGDANVAGDLVIAANPDSTGAYTISDASASAQSVYVGGSSFDVGGAGTLTVNAGGTFTAGAGSTIVYPTGALNGAQDVDDYGVIDFVINIQGDPFPAGPGSSLAAVPEPSVVCGLGVLSGALLSRGRRR